MSDPVGVSQKSSRGAGNKAKLIGAKPPLSPRHVWSIRTRMQLEGRIRDNHRIVLGGPRQMDAKSSPLAHSICRGEGRPPQWLLSANTGREQLQ